MEVSLNSQRDTMRRTLLASGGALLYSFVILLCYTLGYIITELKSLLTLMAVFWIGHLSILGFVFSRYRRKLPAPSMSLPHMIWAIIFVSIILYHAVEIRSAFLMAYLTILPFGAFRLQWRGFLGITLFSLASYALALFLLQLHRPGQWSPEFEVITGLAFLLAMFSYCVLGYEFSLMKNKLSESNERLNVALEKINELAITDELTHLYNRRHLLKVLDQQRALANRDGTPFVLAFIDLDNFKLVNDTFGHRVGDDVLKQFSGLLLDSVREVDLVSRYDGEEFVILLNGVGMETAAIVVERIRSAVEGLEFSDKELAMTISVGITEYQAPETVKGTLERADKLLYQAKKSGRNRIVQDLVNNKLETTD